MKRSLSPDRSENGFQKATRPSSPESLPEYLNHPPERRPRASSPSLMTEDERIEATLERMQHTDEHKITLDDGTKYMLRKDPRFWKGAPEVWAEMPGVVGLWVSTHGNIQYKVQGRWLRPHKPNADKKGYRRFFYAPPRVKKTLFKVHACVATTFLGPPPSKDHTPDHVDVNREGNTSNNCIWNLRWASKSEQNQNQRIKEEAMQSARPCFGRAIDGGGDWVEYKSVVDAAEKLELNSGNISHVCNGKCKRTGEYTFKWMPIPEPLEGEVWKPYKNGKHVSNTGRVKLKSGWIYTPRPTRGEVYASFDTTGFHIVVCTRFHGAAPSKHLTVDHIDRDTTNNRAENLAWKTPSEQNENRDLPALGDGNKDSLKRPVKVIFPDESFQTILGLHEAARQLKIRTQTLQSRIKNKSVIKGMRFEYAE